MSDRSEKDLWVTRILGVSLPGQDAPGADLEQVLRGRRAQVLADAVRLKDGDARQRVEALGAQAGSAIAEGRLGGAHSLLDAMETALAEAQRADRLQGVAAEAGSRVEYAKLQLRWREAQNSARNEIDALAEALLADAEVQADPRYEDVVEAAADLADVLPQFGSALADTLDGLDKMADPARRAEMVEQARSQIEQCKALLEGAAELAELAAFASDEYGRTDLAEPLREALTELAAMLPNRI